MIASKSHADVVSISTKPGEKDKREKREPRNLGSVRDVLHGVDLFADFNVA